MNLTRWVGQSREVALVALLTAVALGTGAMVSLTFRIADRTVAASQLSALGADAWEIAYMVGQATPADAAEVEVKIASTERRSAAAAEVMRHADPARATVALTGLTQAWESLVFQARAAEPGADPAPLQNAAIDVADAVDAALAVGIEASASNTASALALLRGVILATALALVIAGWLALRRFSFMIANLDQSTGLYTPRRMRTRVSSGTRHGRPVSMVAFRLADVPAVRNALGVEAGARLLVQSARRLESVGVPRVDVAVTGDHTLLVLMPGLGRQRALARAAELLEILEEPVQAGDVELSLAVAAGIACGPFDGTRAESLVAAATSASERATPGAQSPASYEAAQDQTQAGLPVVQALHQAAQTHGFEVQYQPIVDLATGVPTGVEALLAWPDAPPEWSGPAMFVPELERLGLMSRVTKETLERAVRDATGWPTLGGDRPLFLAVNLGPSDLLDAALPRRVEDAARAAQLAGISLELEISERVTLDASGLVDSAVSRLSTTGVRVSLDDFGVAQTTLAHIQRLHPDTVKLDRSLVERLTDDAPSRELVRATIQATHALGSRVIAEGVETLDQVDVLRAMGCEMAQGYYFATKMTHSELMEFLGEWSLTTRQVYAAAA